MMLNPWLILAVVLAIGASGASGFFYGQHVQLAEDSAAQTAAVKTAVDDANRLAEADKRKAVLAAAAAATAKTKQQEIRSRANVVIHEAPLAASCDWNEPSFRLLGDAITAANGDAPATDSLPDAVRKANASRKSGG